MFHFKFCLGVATQGEVESMQMNRKLYIGCRKFNRNKSTISKETRENENSKDHENPC